jgi:hypothetical protein
VGTVYKEGRGLYDKICQISELAKSVTKKSVFGTALRQLSTVIEV